MADYNALFDLMATEEAMQMGHGEAYEKGMETVKGIENSQSKDFEDLEQVAELSDMEL